MKFSAVAALLSAGAAVATPAPAWFEAMGPEAAMQDLEKVPGKSPLHFCAGDHSKDTVTIEKVDLDPNPPQPGNKLKIVAEGTVDETIKQGAYVKLVVKYGLIKLVNTQSDLCEQVSNVDLECPIEEGRLSITKEVDLPNEIPPGTFNVEANVFNADDTPITCLTATVKFGINSNEL